MLFALAGNSVQARRLSLSVSGGGWGALEQVTSPTFVIVNEYHRADGSALHHVDAYRLGSEADIVSSGFPERLDAQKTLLIEWPEHVTDWLPQERLWISLDYFGEREAGVTSDSAWGSL